MDRRIFVKHSALYTLGGLLLPNMLYGSPEKEIPKDVNCSGKVLIVGAGIAGLYAGYMLKSEGIDFQILEASRQYGGRLGKLDGFANFPLDLGGEWLHGKKNILTNLIKRSRTKISLDNSEDLYWINKQLVSELPQSIEIFHGDALPDISYKDFATQSGLGSEYQYIIESIAGDYGAAASKLSVLGNYKDEFNWSSGEKDFKFQETYFDFIDKQVARPIQEKILLNTIVKTIDYTQSEILITDQNGKTYQAEKVLITVPITVLQSKDIEFIPSLSIEKTAAFAKIGMGPGMKVFLKFRKPFFSENILGGAICATYIDESIGKKEEDFVLMAFVMGDQAAYLTSLGNDETIKAALLQELDVIYKGQATANFIKVHIQNWTLHPFIRGAYSYSTVGMGNARTIAAQSIDNKIFFAGEAMNIEGHHQTVHGAAETAYKEVMNILDSLRK